LEIRGERVLLDRDIAGLYGVETKHINQAVKNNMDKFPVGYIITLESDDWDSLRSKFLTLNQIDSCQQSDSLRSKFSTLESSGRGQHTKYKPNAFTEKGLYMLATILKSPVATQTTIAIVDAFAKLRELTNVACQLVAVQDISSQESLMIRGGEIISEIFDETIMNVIGNETSFELNLGAFKVKHTVKREKRIT